VNLSARVFSIDLDGNSKYSNANFECQSGEAQTQQRALVDQKGEKLT
jgi:hypothetical protein